jgi:hypothetical protein
MSDYDLELIDRYSGSDVLVDANLMILFLVGSYDLELIPKFKGTKQFVGEDYEALTLILGRFRRIVITPNILTEANSFSNQLREDQKPGYFALFAQVIAQLGEVYLPSIDVARMVEFIRFGLTDAGILGIARDTYLVLTTDARLAVYLQRLGVDVINFNHFRNYL